MDDRMEGVFAYIIKDPPLIQAVPQQGIDSILLETEPYRHEMLVDRSIPKPGNFHERGSTDEMDESYEVDASQGYLKCHEKPSGDKVKPSGKTETDPLTTDRMFGILSGKPDIYEDKHHLAGNWLFGTQIVKKKHMEQKDVFNRPLPILRDECLNVVLFGRVLLQPAPSVMAVYVLGATVVIAIWWPALWSGIKDKRRDSPGTYPECEDRKLQQACARQMFHLPYCKNSFSVSISSYCNIGATVAEWLDCSPPTKVKRVQSLAEPLLDFCKWESCRTMPLVGGFSRGSPFREIVSKWSLLSRNAGVQKLIQCHPTFLSMDLVLPDRLHSVSHPIDYKTRRPITIIANDVFTGNCNRLKYIGKSVGIKGILGMFASWPAAEPQMLREAGEEVNDAEGTAELHVQWLQKDMLVMQLLRQELVAPWASLALFYGHSNICLQA
ncbi:hypothetical protein PR048_002716 [Dryococelus australis]|uniref:Uncharacterized protein n=1 Tax=Dryococelus australis TaxID=614101 RepID=A0ABQ9IMG1_9NEOP|nr:hypothetical protein PR048_002716 [Dryococelus australis]